MKRLKSQQGATLLEVMVAVAVASIALVSFISLVVSALEMEDYGRRVTDATLLADNRIKEIERTGLPELGITEGLMDENDPDGYTYRLTVMNTPIENVRHLVLDVRWNKGRDSVTLETYMLAK